MKRRISALAEKEFDLIVVGGGIFGICAAWDATLRGLSVALVEQADFAHAASANCFKLVHGGVRYLQHGDLYRVRESSHERSALLRVAPHLVNPLPTVVPTYGRGLQSREVLQTGMAIYDLLTLDRNRGIHHVERRLPRARALGRQECLTMFPGLEANGLTGGVLFSDGQMYSPPRLALAFLKSAVNAGAEAANYVKVTGFTLADNRVSGVEAQDVLTGDRLEIRGKMVLNTAGQWIEQLLWQGAALRLEPQLRFSRDVGLVVKRRLTERYAVGLQANTRDPDAILSRGNRHLFMVPWRNYTQIGVWHVAYRGAPDGFTVTDAEIQEFLDEFNQAYALERPVTIGEVSMVNAGLILFGENEGESADLSFAKRSRIVDHAREHGVEGLVTVAGVRFTTARGVGERAIGLALKKLGRRAPKSETATTPVHGGRIESFDQLTRQATQECPDGTSIGVLNSLLRNYGSAYGEVRRQADEDPTWWETLGDTSVIKAEVVHAVREEMAQKLSDVVLRRTDLGAGENPGEDALMTCAGLMAAELEWDRQRVQRELDEVRRAFPAFSMASV